MATRFPTALAVAALTLLQLAAGGFAAAHPGPDACNAPGGEPAFDDDAEVSVWNGDVAPGATGGELLVQSYHAGALIAPWNRSAWRVEVAEVDPMDELQANVEAGDSGAALSLTVRVEPRQGPGGVPTTLTAGAYAQVKVRVPDVAYARLLMADEPTDSGGPVGSPSIGTGASPAWDSVRVHGLNAAETRLTVESRDLAVTNATADALTATTSSGRLTIANLTAGPARVETGSGDACLTAVRAGDLRVETSSGALDADDVAADTLRLTTDSGDATLTNARATAIHGHTDSGSLHAADVVAGSFHVTTGSGDVNATRARLDLLELTVDSADIDLDDVRATTVKATSGSGDLDARGLRVQNLTHASDSGNLEADLIPVGNGTWELATGSGDVTLHVPAGDQYGYDARVDTDTGGPELSIPGTTTVSKGEHHVHVRTPGFDARPIRTTLRVQSASGGVTADDNVRSTGTALPIPPEAAVGLGLAAALGALAYALWPKLHALFAPLYTRLARRDILDHDARRRILALVKEEPGIHFRELKRRTGAGRGILQHHIDKLVEAGVLAQREASGYTCYFATGAVNRHVMDVTHRLRAASARNLLAAVTAHPGATLGELASHAGLSNSTASYHLSKLAEAGLVEKGREGGRLRVDLTELGRRAVEELRVV